MSFLLLLEREVDMATDIENVDFGVLPSTTSRANEERNLCTDCSVKSLTARYGLLALNLIICSIGTIGGPLVLRVYFLHGGTQKWLSAWLETAGWPILFIPLAYLYIHRDRSQGAKFFAEPKLFFLSAIIGLLIGVNNFMYAHGLSWLPVSTSSLLLSTQLAFTAFFALIIVRQKFTPYSINAVVLMTLGSILLGIRKSADRPYGVTSSEYLLGFISTLGAAGLLGFSLPCIEVVYSKSKSEITYSIVLQLQLCNSFFSTVFCTTGMLVTKTFQAIPNEASQYDLGEGKYYLVLVSAAIVWQMMFLGTMGLIFCASSLFAGVVCAALLPMTEVAAVILFSEKFNGEKGMALALSVWGFTSYFYGNYKDNKKMQKKIKAADVQLKHHISDLMIHELDHHL